MQGTFPENLKRLKNTMGGLDWKVSRLPCTGTLSPGAGLGRSEVKGAGEAILRKLKEAYQNLKKAINTEKHLELSNQLNQVPSLSKGEPECSWTMGCRGPAWPSVSLPFGAKPGRVGRLLILTLCLCPL